jgi:hypothetical protein
MRKYICHVEGCRQEEISADSAHEAAETYCYWMAMEDRCRSRYVDVNVRGRNAQRSMIVRILVHPKLTPCPSHAQWRAHDFQVRREMKWGNGMRWERVCTRCGTRMREWRPCDIAKLPWYVRVDYPAGLGEGVGG